MTEDQYERWTEPLRARPRATRALLAANKALTCAGYVAYPLLLVLSAWLRPDLLARCIVVPGVSFALVTLFRSRYDAPRPYEVLDIQPLIRKHTQGRSFPSRHTFSMFAIAAAWATWQPAIGAALTVAGVLMAAVRVLGGVHFPRDVAAGAAAAIVLSAVGYLLVPW